MLLGKQYKIGSDSLNIIFYRRAKPRKGATEGWRAEAYFATVKNALKYLVDNEVRESGLQDLKTVVEKQDQLYALIKSLDLGELKNVKVSPQDTASELQGNSGVASDVPGCNTTTDKENLPPANVTAYNKADVTAKITELAAKGMSSRAIAEELQAGGVRISHMTIARRLQAVLL